MLRRLIFALILCILSVCSVSAHPGRTDGNGGHRDSSTGEYHYHHGYSAHQHTDGVCPYDFDDKTGWDSGTTRTSTTSKDTQGKTSISVSPATLKPKAKQALSTIIMILAGVLYVVPMCISIFGLIVEVSETAVTYIKKRFHIETKKEKQKRLLNEVQQEIRRTVYEEQQKKLRHDLISCLQEILRQKEEKIRIEQEERIRIETETRNKYISMYGGKSPAECSGMPSDVEIGSDGLPKERGSDNWGQKYTLYISPKGKAYHCRYGCSSARIPVHAYRIRSHGYVSCLRCMPTIPDFSWYEKYTLIESIKHNYKID